MNRVHALHGRLPLPTIECNDPLVAKPTTGLKRKELS